MPRLHFIITADMTGHELFPEMSHVPLLLGATIGVVVFYE